MFVMHPPAVRQEALALVARGLNDCEVARRTGRAASDCSRLAQAAVQAEARRRHPLSALLAARPPGLFSHSDYAELLGLYLGDGHIVRVGRTYRLRLFLDTCYPGIIEEARQLLCRCFARNAVGLSRSRKGSTSILSVYSRHLPCLFPQHGSGKKHERPIVLEGWQRECLEAAPMNFIRGCIRSDGCYFVNRTGPYSYPSYTFENHSADIRRLFEEARDLAGIRYRRSRTSLRIYRRESVAVLLRAVGPKA